jgi:hypothetical protein
MLDKYVESMLFTKILLRIFFLANSNIFMIKKYFEVFLLRKDASEFSPEMDLKTRFLIKHFSRRITKKHKN